MLKNISPPFAMLDGSACRFHTSCLGIPVSLIITPPFTPSNGSACLFGIGCVDGAGYGARISQGSAVQGYATFLGCVGCGEQASGTLAFASIMRFGEWSRDAGQYSKAAMLRRD